MEQLNPNDVNLIFKQLTEELSAPLLTLENFNHTINFINNDLRPLYEFNDDIRQSIHYFCDMANEINTNETSEEKIFGLTLIVDKYLCVKNNNKIYIESKYAIVQYIIQACFNQILQQLFRTIHKKNMDTNDIEDALNLFKDTFGDIIASANGYKLCEKLVDLN